MVWNKALPSTTEKLRTLSGVITDNWSAIEEADETSGTPIFQRAVLLGDRDVIASAADPVVIGATTYLYSRKDDTNSVQEAFIRAPAGAVVPVTQGGRLGSDITDIGFESFSHNEGTRSYDENNFVAAWGFVIDSSLSISPSSGGLSGVTFNAGSPDYYEISFSASKMGNSNYCVMAIAEGTGDVFVTDKAQNDTSKFRITRTTAGGASSRGDFYFMVVGGQT